MKKIYYLIGQIYCKLSLAFRKIVPFLEHRSFHYDWLSRGNNFNSCERKEDDT